MNKKKKKKNMEIMNLLKIMKKYYLKIKIFQRKKK